MLLEANENEQKRRFEARIEDPLGSGVSPTDLELCRRWYDYSRARDRVLDTTDAPWASWHIMRSDTKRHARLNCIRHLLSLLP
jgi:polyphosphate kinase 2 (PPK2 family)